MKIIRISGKIQYIGDCTEDDTLDYFGDATLMSNVVENGTPYDIDSILPHTFFSLREKVLLDNSNFECKRNGSICWIYDIEDDIHYFFNLGIYNENS